MAKPVEACKTCVFWRPDKSQKRGECRRYPRTFHPVYTEPRYPVHNADDDCGEWQQKTEGQQG